MKQTPAKQDKPTPFGFQPSRVFAWLALGCAFGLGLAIGGLYGYTSAFSDVRAFVADRAVRGEAARGAGGRGGAVPLGNHGEINSVVTE